MTEQDDERLSALVDGELPDAERDRLLDSLAGQPDLLRTWSRYQLIGTAIRYGIPEAHDPGLPARVRDAIGETLPEGQPGDAGLEPVAADVSAGGWRRAAGGLAMAASVAALALFGVSQLTPTTEGPRLVAGQANQSPVPGSLALSVTERDPAATGNDLDHERLTRYLMRHNEYASAGGMRGLPPNVRVVSQGSSRPVR